MRLHGAIRELAVIAASDDELLGAARAARRRDAVDGRRRRAAPRAAACGCARARAATSSTSRSPGRTAVVEEIVERTWTATCSSRSTVEDDPGRDLGDDAPARAPLLLLARGGRAARRRAAAAARRRAILVAGIGNVFLGDDGFGVAVAGRLGAARAARRASRSWTSASAAWTSPTRSQDYDVAVFVDAVPRGERARARCT